MRVHQLAKEYDKKSSDFLGEIQGYGINVFSHLSGLSDDEVATIRQKIETKEVAIKLESEVLERQTKKDDWTLGSGDTVVETDKVGVSTEDIEEALAANIKAAGGAREKYAETVQAIAEDPKNWSSPTARQDDDKEWTEKVTEADAWADAKIEEGEDAEKLTFWGWLKSLFI